MEKVEPGGPGILSECLELYLKFLRSEKIRSDLYVIISTITHYLT